MDVRYTEAASPTPVYVRGILHPASYRILLPRRHPPHRNNKCYIENGLRNNCRTSFWAVIFQHVGITPSHHGNKLNSTSVAAEIALLAMQCYFLKNALLWLCQQRSTMAFPFVWSQPYFLSGDEPKRTFLNPIPLLPDIYIRRNDNNNNKTYYAFFPIYL